MHSTRAHVLRFANFELDVERAELRKSGVMIKLQAQPIKILALLADRSGELISRQEIQNRVWGSETFVDFEQGINTCIRQIRLVLGDNANTPRFVETVPRRGYRFLAPVERSAEAAGVAEGPPGATPSRPAERSPGPARRPWLLSGGVAALAAAVVVGAMAVQRDGSRAALQVAAAAKAPAALTQPERSAARSEAAASPMLAVLPFHNYSAEPAEDYLADGMTEELITELARRYGGRLGVIARTSVMRFKHSEQGIDAIAAELGAQFVLEGSIRQAGERIRVTAQLIRAADQDHLWAGSYDRELADILELQAEVSSKIGQALALTLQLVPQAESGEVAATHPQAYDAYLKGRYYLNHLLDPGNEPLQSLSSARSYLERATRLDPGFAPAHVELGRAYRLTPPHRENVPKARDAFTRALALDDALAAAHLQLALLRFYYDLDLEGARRGFERALELNPGFAEAHHDFAAYFSVTGRHDEAVASVGRALRLDPLSPSVTSDVGWYYYFARRFEEAITHSRRTLSIEPGYVWAEECVLLASIASGDLAAAAAYARDDMRGVDATEGDLAALRRDDPRDALQAYWRWRLAWHQRAAEKHFVPATEFAICHMALGDTEKALAALEQAYVERVGWIRPFLPVHPFFAPLRSEDRFMALLEKIAGGESSI